MERELLRRLAWGAVFTIGLAVFALIFHAGLVFIPVVLFVLWFTLTKKA